ncbi:MAG: FGGY-family carbohydrate kinase [Desulfobacterales bacterium]|nr:MAG: FGGY-family carbohydrate kinase [Desulfobacterales bacterium]
MGKKELYFLGTDIGTLGTKSVVVTRDGEIVSSDYREYGVLTPKPLWAEQWPDVWFLAVAATIKNALVQGNIPSHQVGGLTISGLYGGSGIPCAADMRPLRPCLIWMDRRATDEVGWVKDHIGEDQVFAITGNYIDSYYGFTKMLWLKNKEPDVWKKIKWLLTPYAYAIYHLTGSLSMDYCSAGNIGGIFDIHKRDWSADLLREMQIPREFFPEKLVRSAEVVGKINRQGAQLTGLAEGTPVCAGGVDAAVATLSAGAFDEGDHVAMIGTSMAYGVIHSGENFSKNLISMPHVAYDEEKVYSFGGAATAGGIIKWFRDEFGQIEKTYGGIVDVDAYDLLTLKAAKVNPGSDRLMVLPYFMGERAPIWNVDARGTVFGLTLYHTRAHLFRACLEAVAYALRTCVEFSQRLGLRLKRDLIMVGGATKSALWKSIFADITKFPILCTSGGGEAPYADAFLAAVGVGAIDSYETIQDWLSFEPGIEPHPDRAAVYDDYYQQYMQLYEALKPSMSRLQQLP